MRCDRCGDEAVIHQGYSGAHLCETHLRRSVEKRVRRRIREDGLVPETALPEDPVTWVIGLSGGKDSAVLTHLLHETFARDPRVELEALTIHEGIEGYRDESVAACEELAARLELPLELVTYEDEFGVRMDDVVEQEAATMAPCAYCGVFRRDVLERHASHLGADTLLTGHNLDDEAQTALMNFLSGDVDRMGRHFEASLGPMPDRAESADFVPRAKPLRDIPEREVALYAHLADLPVHFNECPHASEAFRGEVQALLHDLEDAHPGTRHGIMAGYERLAELAASEERETDVDLSPCERCESLTSRELCRSCALLDQLGARA